MFDDPTQPSSRKRTSQLRLRCALDTRRERTRRHAQLDLLVTEAQAALRAGRLEACIELLTAANRYREV